MSAFGAARFPEDVVSGPAGCESVWSSVCERYGIARLDLFGSVARGDGPVSDIDVLDELRPGTRLGWEIEDLNDDLSALFGRRVDLVSRRALHPLRREPVLAESRALYAA